MKKLGNEIIPSTASFISASSPIYECVRVMELRKSRAALITEHLEGQLKVVGIFTESDFIRRYQFFRKSGNWILPIRSIMNSPIKYLPFEEIRNAAEFMVKWQIRSVPLLSRTGELTTENICGVVNAFDLVTFSTKKHADERVIAKVPFVILLMSKNEKYADFLNALPFNLARTHVVRIEKALELKSNLSILKGKATVCIVDADHFTPEESLEAMAAIEDNGDASSRVILYDETVSGAKIVSISEGAKELGSSFRLVRKPLDPFAFIEFVENKFAISVK